MCPNKNRQVQKNQRSSPRLCCREKDSGNMLGPSLYERSASTSRLKGQTSQNIFKYLQRQMWITSLKNVKKCTVQLVLANIKKTSAWSHQQEEKRREKKRKQEGNVKEEGRRKGETRRWNEEGRNGREWKRQKKKKGRRMVEEKWEEERTEGKGGNWKKRARGREKKEEKEEKERRYGKWWGKEEKEGGEGIKWRKKERSRRKRKDGKGRKKRRKVLREKERGMKNPLLSLKGHYSNSRGSRLWTNNYRTHFDKKLNKKTSLTSFK